MQTPIFMYDDKLRVPWANEFKELYFTNLKALGADIHYVDTMTGLEGYAILCDYSEFLRYIKAKGRTTSIMQMNATAVNPFIYHVSEEEEIDNLAVVDINLTGHPDHTKLTKEKYNIDNVYTAGFPVRPYVGRNPKIKGTFCIGGRLSPDKLVYESLRMCLNHPECKKIIVCYPASSADLLQYYPKRSYIEYRQCEHQEFLDVLRCSEYYVIASLGDTGSVSTVEAIQRDCKVITKEYGLPLPYYSTIKDNLHLFDPRECAERLIKIMKQHESLQR